MVAVADVSLAFEAKRIHAVVGENGAGKTTLLRVAAGLVAADSGTVMLDGVPATRRALHRSVSMVEQHFALAGAMSALDHVMLGVEPVRAFGRLDRERARARAEVVAREVGASILWDARVETFGVGEKQRLEIVRALVRDARVIVLDEPTAALTQGEAVALYATLRRMADGGRAIVVVTHRLDEVREHADQVSVMRHGHLVSSRALTDRSEGALQAIARDAMGENEPPVRARAARPVGEERLSLRDARRAPGLRGVTLSVRSGEIVGIAGVDGNGQRELVRVLAGLEPLDGGELRATAAAVVHEDRSVEGLVLDASVRDNLVLGELARFSSFGIVRTSILEHEVTSRFEQAGIVPAGPGSLDAPARSLSGGNQQKIVIQRALSRIGRESVLVLAQPTRGVDLASADAILDAVRQAAADGAAILVVSADLDELRALCDRILVLSRGVVAAELPPDASDRRFGKAMLGAGSPGASA